MTYAKWLIAWVMFGLLGAILPQNARSDVAYAQASNKDDIIASVDDVRITRADLENAISDRVKIGTKITQEIRSMALKELIGEAIAEKLVSSKEILRTPSLARKLDAARRHVLVEYYLEKNIAPEKPALEDVKKFISDHPRYFQDRKMFHYSELIVEAKTPPLRQAVGDRLRLLAEHKEPTPQAMDMVREWLNQNNVSYSYNKSWKDSESLPPNIQNAIIDLAESGKTVDFKESGDYLGVLALYGVYPDPIDPLLARNAVAQKLMEESKQKQRAVRADGIFARAKVVLYDKSFKDLKIPTSSVGVVEESWEKGSSLGERAYLAWNFAMLIFAPIAVYLFYRQTLPVLEEYNTRTVIDRISYHIAFRIAVVIIMGGALLLTAFKVLEAGYLNEDTKTYLTIAVAGLGFGLAMVFLFIRIGVLRTFLSSRWLTLTGLFIIQLSSTLLLD